MGLWECSFAHQAGPDWHLKVLGQGANQFLGMQGDPWDAQKDMGLASLGALVAMCVTAAVNARLQRDFAREWADSLRVKHPAPLGEDEIARMMQQKK